MAAPGNYTIDLALGHRRLNIFRVSFRASRHFLTFGVNGQVRGGGGGVAMRRARWLALLQRISRSPLSGGDIWIKVVLHQRYTASVDG